jgi:hypothetical protein
MLDVMDYSTNKTILILKLKITRLSTQIHKPKNSQEKDQTTLMNQALAHN